MVRTSHGRLPPLGVHRAYGRSPAGVAMGPRQVVVEMKIIGVGAALGMAAIALLAPPSTARGVPEDVTIDIHVERGCPTPDSCVFSASGAITDEGMVVTESIKAFALPSPVVGTAQYVRTFIGELGSITTRLESRIQPTDDPAVWHEEGRWVVVSATGMYAELDGWGNETGTRNFGIQSLDTAYTGYLRRGPAHADSGALP